MIIGIMCMVHNIYSTGQPDFLCMGVAQTEVVQYIVHCTTNWLFNILDNESTTFLSLGLLCDELYINFKAMAN